MAVYDTMVLTQKGQALLTKVQTGTQLNFTRMQIGSGQLAAGQDPTALTALVSPIGYFAINSISTSGNTALIRGIFTNAAITSSKYTCEIGLFAQDPTAGEILYGYATAGSQGDTIPPISSGPLSKQFTLSVAIGNASSVTATVPSDAYILATDKGAANGVAPLDAGGHITDTVIGSRTITDTSDSGNTGTLTTLLSNLANRIKAAVASLTSHTGASSGAHAASAISLSSSNFASNNVKAGMEELFTSASNGKTSIAAAVTGKGVAASGSDTFSVLASKVSQIVTLAQGSADATAAAADILINKIAYNAGVKVTGTMPDRGAPTITPGTADQALSPGRYTGGTVKGDSKLVSGNIKYGETIFDVPGSLQPGYAASGTGTSTGGALTVTGLGFKPKIIVIHQGYTTPHYRTEYIEAESTTYCRKMYIPGPGVTATTAQAMQSITIDGATYYVSNGGFKLPIVDGSCSWYAYG